MCRVKGQVESAGRRLGPEPGAGWTGVAVFSCVLLWLLCQPAPIPCRPHDALDEKFEHQCRGKSDSQWRDLEACQCRRVW